MMSCCRCPPVLSYQLWPCYLAELECGVLTGMWPNGPHTTSATTKHKYIYFHNMLSCRQPGVLAAA